MSFRLGRFRGLFLATPLSLAIGSLSYGVHSDVHAQISFLEDNLSIPQCQQAGGVSSRNFPPSSNIRVTFTNGSNQDCSVNIQADGCIFNSIMVQGPNGSVRRHTTAPGQSIVATCEVGDMRDGSIGAGFRPVVTNGPSNEGDGSSDSDSGNDGSENDGPVDQVGIGDESPTDDDMVTFGDNDSSPFDQNSTETTQENQDVNIYGGAIATENTVALLENYGGPGTQSLAPRQGNISTPDRIAKLLKKLKGEKKAAQVRAKRVEHAKERLKHWQAENTRLSKGEREANAAREEAIRNFGANSQQAKQAEKNFEKELHRNSRIKDAVDGQIDFWLDQIPAEGQDPKVQVDFFCAAIEVAQKANDVFRKAARVKQRLKQQRLRMVRQRQAIRPGSSDEHLIPGFTNEIREIDRRLDDVDSSVEAQISNLVSDPRLRDPFEGTGPGNAAFLTGEDSLPNRGDYPDLNSSSGTSENTTFFVQPAPQQASETFNALFLDEENNPNGAKRINQIFNLTERDANGVSGLTTWVKGAYTNASGGAQATARDSQGFNIATGLQYQLTDFVAMGLAVRFANTSNRTIGGGTEIDTNLFGGALFTTITLPKDVSIQLTSAAETATNDVISAGNTGSFNLNSLVFSASASKVFNLGDSFTFTPNATYSTSGTNQESYTNSAGARINGQRFNVSVLTYGGTFSGTLYESQSENFGIQQISASIGLSGTTFLERAAILQDQSSVANLQNDSGGANFSGGLNFGFDNAVTASLGGSLTLAGDGDLPWSVNGSVNVPLDRLFTEAPLRASQFRLTGNYIDLPDGRNVWTLGGSLDLQLRSVIKRAPVGSTLSFTSNVTNGDNAAANAILKFPLQ